MKEKWDLKRGENPRETNHYHRIKSHLERVRSVIQRVSSIGQLDLPQIKDCSHFTLRSLFQVTYVYYLLNLHAVNQLVGSMALSFVKQGALNQYIMNMFNDLS